MVLMAATTATTATTMQTTAQMKKQKTQDEKMVLQLLLPLADNHPTHQVLHR